MSVPKGAKITKNGIEYVNNVEYCKYTMKELIRAALRDCGKLFCQRFRSKFYSSFRRRKGKVGKYTQYWVRSKQNIPDLLVGIKPNGWYGSYQEFGSSKTPRLGYMLDTANDNIDEFQKLQAQYLSAMNNDDVSVDDSEFMGGAE